jgi:hypothetical protein
VTACGPQENLKDSEKMLFHTALEEEITAAELEGRSVLIAFDANAKLGPKYIKGDPHTQ